MVHDGTGNVLDVGRRTRVVPAAIRRALEQRDGGCRFPGCNRRICDAHHIRHWADSGRTRLGNLALLCLAHHRAVHEDGFGRHISPDRTISFMRPDGRPLPDVPPLPRLREDSVGRLVAANHDLGLEIDPWTSTPPWHGERLDLDYAIRGLRAVNRICQSLPCSRATCSASFPAAGLFAALLFDLPSAVLRAVLCCVAGRRRYSP